MASAAAVSAADLAVDVADAVPPPAATSGGGACCVPAAAVAVAIDDVARESRVLPTSVFCAGLCTAAPPLSCLVRDCVGEEDCVEESREQEENA